MLRSCDLKWQEKPVGLSKLQNCHSYSTYIIKTSGVTEKIKSNSVGGETESEFGVTKSGVAESALSLLI